MLDFGFEKILIIAVVGVVVLGPERLPVAAKMLGILWARTQKITQKFRQELSELEKLAKTPNQMLNQAEEKMQNFYQEFEEESKSWENLKQDFNQDFDIFLQKQKHIDQSFNQHENPDEKWANIEKINQKSQYRHSNWRLKSMATPIWFQRKTQKKRRIEGAAARIQRYRLGKSTALKSSIF